MYKRIILVVSVIVVLSLCFPFPKIITGSGALLCLIPLIAWIVATLIHKVYNGVRNK